MRALVNAALRPDAVPAPSGEARAFHEALPGYAPTPVHALDGLAAELGLGAVLVKDESSRLGLPAFKVLGASWAVERAVRDEPGIHTLVAASAGNHGRAVARVAAMRGLACRVLLPARSSPARRAAIASEGAEVVIVDGDYEAAVARAAEEAARPGVLEVADVGGSPAAHAVIDGYATLFAELGEDDDSPGVAGGPSGGVADVLVVPVGVGSLAAAAARHGASAGMAVIAAEPERAACLTASLAAGHPVAVPTPGTSMAGLDCAEVSPAAWPALRDGIAGTVTVADAEAHAAMRELAAAGLAIGDSGAAPLAALRALVADPACARLREAVRLGPRSRVLLVATEGPTDPDAYAAVVSPSGRR
jgi:diaminopropionate ammonia-lyase